VATAATWPSSAGTGAERIYLPEEGVSLADLQTDVAQLVSGFAQGRRLGLVIRNEHTDPLYTTAFMCALFEKEGHDLFDVRQAILGHVQQGGNPSPFDRVQATRLAAKCIEFLTEAAAQTPPPAVAIGLQGGNICFTELVDLPRLTDDHFGRPKEQWWLELRPIARLMAHPGSQVLTEPAGSHAD